MDSYVGIAADGHEGICIPEDEVEEMLANTHILVKKVRFRRSDTEDEYDTIYTGMGFNYKGRVLTCEHVVEAEYNVKKEMNSSAHVSFVDSRIFIDDTEVKVINKDYDSDLAVLEVPQKYRGHSPIGSFSRNSDQSSVLVGHKKKTILERGGVKMNLKKTLKPGLILPTIIYGHRGYGEEKRFNIKHFPGLAAKEGDSGAPIYRRVNGRYVVIGMYNTSSESYERIDGAHRIDNIIEDISPYV